LEPGRFSNGNLARYARKEHAKTKVFFVSNGILGLIYRGNGIRETAWRWIRDIGVIITDESEKKKIEENDQGNSGFVQSGSHAACPLL